jgi:hypothetical protein
MVVVDTIVHHNRAVLVVDAEGLLLLHPSYCVEESCAVVMMPLQCSGIPVVVDLVDNQNAVHRIHLPNQGMSIHHRNRGHHVANFATCQEGTWMGDDHQHYNEDRDNSPVDNNKDCDNATNPSSLRISIRSCQNCSVPPRRPVTDGSTMVERMIVPTILIGYHTPTDMSQVEVDHN